MSKAIKPKQGVVYECYKGFTDPGGDRARKGQKFIWDGSKNHNGNFYELKKASGRGVEIYVPVGEFASYFYPTTLIEVEQNEQSETKIKLKVGDRVKIDQASEFYGDASDDANPMDIAGTIYKVEDHWLGIYVKWDNDEENSYDEDDLILVEAEQGSYLDINEKLKHMNLTAITVSSTEQIKELAKVSFLKDQIEAAFPDLFVTHKTGNRYKHEDGSRYILTGENGYVALTNLKTGMIESYTVRVKDYDKITSDEFKQLCLDYKELTLIKERQ